MNETAIPRIYRVRQCPRIPRLFVLAALTPCLLVSRHGYTQEDNKNAKPINVGSQSQLFVDDYFIERSQGIELAVNPPRNRYMGTSQLQIPSDGSILGLLRAVTRTSSSMLWLSCCFPRPR